MTSRYGLQADRSYRIQYANPAFRAISWTNVVIMTPLGRLYS
jgi:hypothetical protein